jgi:tetratricopeptide (TPR) repeat protein
MSAAAAEAAGAGAVLWSGMCPRILLNRIRWRRGALLAAGLAVTAAVAHSEDSWRDIESRIQYGYYTEDAVALRHLPELIDAGDAHDRLRGYYGGLLAWRLASLAARSPGSVPGSSAAALAQRCVRALDEALELQAEFADALALRFACRAIPYGAGGGYASIAGQRGRRDLERAQQLAARNPRVLLLDAMSEYELASGKSGNRERALAKLRQAVAAFEAERGGAEQQPGWGAAEAWQLLGRELLERGDPIGARDALEHALLIAPEFVQARRLMAKIISG